MIYDYIIENLEKNAGIFKSLLEKISPEQARWKPSAQKWSLLEVINHLYDEEREDFRQRLKSVLENPHKAWTPNDPEKWVIEREYNKREMTASLNNFLAERRKSIEWLKSLSSPNWQSAYTHPQIGKMSAEMLLVNWLAHDYLHFRQISFLCWSYLSSKAPAINLDYAGNW